MSHCCPRGCGCSSRCQEEARREKTDVCENEAVFEERVTKVKGEKEQVKRVRFREEEEPEETRAQITTVAEEGQVQSKVGTEEEVGFHFR